jgi:hypothetical protein
LPNDPAHRDGGNDELVELYNPTSADITLDASWSIMARSSAAASYGTRFVRSGQVIPAHGHFLIGGSAYGGITRDAALSTGITDAGSVKIVHAGAVVDSLCYCFDATTCAALGGAGYDCEGTPASNLPHDNTTGGGSNADVSLERLPGGGAGSWWDSDDNASDFHSLAPAEPQNAASALTP